VSVGAGEEYSSRDVGIILGVGVGSTDGYAVEGMCVGDGDGTGVGSDDGDIVEKLVGEEVGDAEGL